MLGGTHPHSRTVCANLEEYLARDSGCYGAQRVATDLGFSALGVAEPLIGSLARGVESQTNRRPRVPRVPSGFDRGAQILIRLLNSLARGDDRPEVCEASRAVEVDGSSKSRTVSSLCIGGRSPLSSPQIFVELGPECISVDDPIGLGLPGRPTSSSRRPVR